MRQKILPVDVDIILYLDALSKGAFRYTYLTYFCCLISTHDTRSISRIDQVTELRDRRCYL